MKPVYILICTIAVLMLSCNHGKEDARPNILFIMADDLGYGDLGCYNPESLVPTPNLDKLASEGVMLTDAYCPVSVCSPSRYALMTGRYPFRSWRKAGVMRNYEPSMIGDEVRTIPEMLQTSGYTTAGFGKWHLGATFPTIDGKEPAGYGEFRADDNGANLDLSKPVTDGPLDYGFDHWLGFSCASETWILEDNRITAALGHDLYTIEATPNKDHIRIIPLADYLPFITSKTLDYLETSSANTQPLFLYFAPYVPHIPLAVSDEFKGKTTAGLYGDYAHELDYYVGKILDKFAQLGMSNNTIVFFASDNGSQFLITSPELDMQAATNNPQDVVSGEDIQGHRPNGQLRGTKWSIYEGGVRTPFIARWPEHIPPGTQQTGIFGLNDMMATLASIIDYDLGKSGEDSQNQWPMLQGSRGGIRQDIVVQSSGYTYGLRSEDWKYILNIRTDEEELYNLQSDPGETQNEAASMPEIANKLKLQLMEAIGQHVE